MVRVLFKTYLILRAFSRDGGYKILLNLKEYQSQPAICVTQVEVEKSLGILKWMFIVIVTFIRDYIKNCL